MQNIKCSFNIRAFLCLLFLSGIFIKHGFTIGNIHIPYPLCILVGFLLLAININMIKKTDLFYILLLIFAVIYISILSLHTGYINERINGFIQLFIVLFSCFGFFLEISIKDKKYFSKLSYYILLFILITSVLELIPVTRSILDNIKAMLYGYDEQYYISRELRAQIMGFGFVRTTALSQEPSHAAMFSFVFASIWYLTTESKIKNIIFLLGSLALAILIRSPILIFNFLLLGIMVIKEKGLFNFRNIIVISTLIGCFTYIINYLLSQRIGMILSGADGSVNIRIFSSFYYIYLSFINNPFFGSGFMNNEYLLDLYYKYTGDTDLLWRHKEGNTYILNNIGAHFAYFGIGGSLIISTILYNLFRRMMKKTDILFYAIIFCIAVTISGYAGQRMWGFIFLLLGTFRSLNNFSLKQNMKNKHNVY